jgi:hypothetical protein
MPDNMRLKQKESGIGNQDSGLGQERGIGR